MIKNDKKNRGAETVPRDLANENNRHKINDLSHFLPIKTR